MIKVNFSAELNEAIQEAQKLADTDNQKYFVVVSAIDGKIYPINRTTGQSEVYLMSVKPKQE